LIHIVLGQLEDCDTGLVCNPESHILPSISSLVRIPSLVLCILGNQTYLVGHDLSLEVGAAIADVRSLSPSEV